MSIKGLNESLRLLESVKEPILTSTIATVGKTGVPTNGNISIAPPTAPAKSNTKKKYAYYNEAGQRLDLPLPPKDPAAAASLDVRMKKGGKKMCNHWYVLFPKSCRRTT